MGCSRRRVCCLHRCYPPVTPPDPAPEPEQLSTPTELVYDNGTLTWTGDVNATRYELANLVGETYTSIGSTAGTEETFNIAILGLDPDTYNIAVMAIGDEPEFEEYTNSEWSTTVEVVISE